MINNLAHQPDRARDLWDTYEKAAQEVQNGATMRMAMISVSGQKVSINEQGRQEAHPGAEDHGLQAGTVDHALEGVTENMPGSLTC